MTIVLYADMTIDMRNSSVEIDLYTTFGRTIASFQSREVKITNLMWSHQIRVARHESSLDIRVLRRWLAPQDSALAPIAGDNLASKIGKEPFTCQWIQPRLFDFMRGNHSVWSIEGKAGSGKTTIASWLTERLQSPLGRRSVSPVFYSIRSDMPSQASPGAVLKGIISQLFDLCVGDIDLYLALVKAYEQITHSGDIAQNEEYLWKAFDAALEATLDVGEEVVLIVDGLDETFGGLPAAQSLSKKLCEITKGHKHLKTILLSQPLNTKTDSRLEITQDLVHEDIKALIRKALRSVPAFNDQSSQDREKIVERLTASTEGSFLWAGLTCKLLALEKTHQSFNQAVEKAEKAPKSVVDVVTKHLTTPSELSNDSKAVLSWLLAAERPLRVSEVRTLLQVDPRGATLGDKPVDVRQVLQPLHALINVVDGLVFIRAAIRQSLFEIAEQGKVPLPFKDRHRDFTTRLLIYLNSSLSEDHEPTLTPFGFTFVDDLFSSKPLLEYAVRYWILHFRQASPSKTSGFPQEFKSIFPSSTTLPILERTCWDWQLPIPTIIELHSITVAMRREALRENHPAVLQSYINCAYYYETINKVPDAAACFFFCSRIGRAILPHSTVTITCATTFLRLTKTITSTSRTDVITRKEEILKLIIEFHKHQHGPSSSQVIEFQNILAELYVQIQEEDKATEIYRIIYDVTVDQYGKQSDEVKSLHDSLRIVLNKGKEENEIVTWDRAIFGVEEEDSVDIMDIRRVTIILRKAQTYETSGDILMAEQTYIELWLRITQHCRQFLAVEWHEKKLDVVLAYVHFLHKAKRDNEVSAILLSVWQEYEHNELALQESLMTRFVEVAKVMKSVSLHSTALSVFKTAYSFYKSIRKEESSTFRDIQSLISSTSSEVMKSSSSSSSSSVTSDSVLYEIFQSTISSTTTTVDKNTLELSKHLTSIYIEQQKWSEAVNVLKTVISKTWSQFFSSSIEALTLTSESTFETLELIEKLATCYASQLRWDKVEEIYLRIFQAVRVSCKIDDALVTKYSKLLITFYEQRAQVDKAIRLYQELLIEYRKFYGESHDITILTLYSLAALCRTQVRSHAYFIEYYLQIIVSLNKDADVCHPRAMEAIIIVAEYYTQDKRYAESLFVYKLLWSTFVHKAKDYKEFTVEFVQSLYERYIISLEETHASYETLRLVTLQYRETVAKVFSTNSTIYVHATMSLAHIYSRNEKYEAEAIALYEELLNSSTTVVNKQSIKQTLTGLYSKHIASMTSSSSTTSTTTLEKAVTIIRERFSETRSKYGYTHESSLTQLQELVLLYQKQKRIDVAIKELDTTIVQIITKETSSKKLLESAQSLAATYRAIHCEQHASELIQELHRQIIFKDARSKDKFGVDVTQSHRSAIVFLASFEYAMRTDLTITFSEIMADIMTESIYLETYKRTIKSKASIETIFVSAARIRTFLIEKKREQYTIGIVDELIDIFNTREGAVMRESKTSIRQIVIVMLEYYGRRRTSSSFVKSVNIAGVEAVRVLLKQKRFEEAYQVAICTFKFTRAHDGYSAASDISYGFKLSLYMAGRGGADKTQDAELRKKMLDLSKNALGEVLQICSHLKINFAQMQLSEINDLLGLLGEQEDYQSLEVSSTPTKCQLLSITLTQPQWLLSELWKSREAQQSWSPETSLAIGRKYIEAAYSAGHRDKAIHLCEDIAYNLRRVRGARHADTLNMYALLSQLYTAAGHYQKAISVHEDVLRLQIDSGDAEYEETESISGLLGAPQPAQVKKHMRLLKAAFQRNGGWPKDDQHYERLNAAVFREFQSDLQGFEGVEKWNAKGFGGGKAESDEGAFKRPTKWEFMPSEVVVAHA